MAKRETGEKPAPPKDTDDYLAKISPDMRAMLEDLRKVIGKAAPEAVEAISYGIPAFKLNGKPLVSFGAAQKHCGFYVMSPAVMEAHAAELEAYDSTKGAIRFPVAKPLPKALITKLVKARIAESMGKRM